MQNKRWLFAVGIYRTVVYSLVFVWSKAVTWFTCAQRLICGEKNISLTEKYYKFGWDSAEPQKIGGARRRLTKD